MMRWQLWVGVGLAVLLLVAAPTLAAKKEGAAGEKPAKAAKPAKAPKAAKPERSVITGQYKEMVDWCALDANQQAQLEAAIKARNEKVKAWEEANAATLKDLQTKMAEARKAENKDAMKAAQDQMKPLSEARQKVQAEGEAAIAAVLTADQKDLWAGHSLYQSATSRLRKANLTEAQQKQVREMAIAAGKGIAAAADRKAQGAIQKKLAEDIEANVLTAEQKEALKAPPKEKPAREGAQPKQPKAKPEKTAKAPAAIPDADNPAGF